MPSSPSSWFRIVAPGLLLAATGVGAGDLATSAVVASEVGLSVLWAAPFGAALKWVLSEGVARWQLATGTTVLEGWSWRLGGWIRYLFLVYLLTFTIIVGRALTSACGVAGSGLFPIGDAATSVLVWGAIHSLAGMALVLLGSYRFFEVLMSALVGVMFVTVIFTAAALAPPWSELLRALQPSIPEGGSRPVLALLGGIGGTVVLLSYGYWIQEQGRVGRPMLRICRLDLAVGNLVTGLFGMAVIIIGSRLDLEGGGARLALQMADQLAGVLGPPGRWIFLLGFWAAVFSSLLGVWQSIPYLAADLVDIRRGPQERAREKRNLRKTRTYRGAVAAIAILPLFFLGSSVRSIQLAYGVFAACFLPILAATLLVMNNRRTWVGEEFLTPRLFNVVIAIAVVFFGYLGALEFFGG